MNKHITEDSTKERAMKLYSYGTVDEDFGAKIKKEKDVAVLKELYMLCFNKNQETLMKKVKVKLDSLGVSPF